MRWSSMPCDPLGDILWNLVQAKLQREISTELREAGLHVSLPSNDGIGFTTPPHDDAATTAYVDDVTFMTSAPARQLYGDATKNGHFATLIQHIQCFL